MNEPRRRLRRALLTGSILAAGVGSAALAPQVSHAATSSMKLNGPAFMLSNAHTVQSVLTISDAQSNITGLQFTVHGPSGTKLSKVRFGKAWSGYAPKVSYVADQASTTYVISTTVKTAKATTYAVSCQDILLNQTTSVRSTVTLAGAENTTSTTTMTG